MKLVAFAVLFVAVARCQETLDDDSKVSTADDRKEKRGISLNLGQGGFEGYSYLGPAARGLNYRQGYSQGYTPITEFGYDGVNYGIGSSNFAGGVQGGYQGYNNPNQPYGSYPYRGGYPSAYSYQRQYNTPVNTYPLGGIGTVGPYGGAYPGFSGGYNRVGNEGLGFGGSYQQQVYPQQQAYPQQGYQQQGYY